LAVCITCLVYISYALGSEIESDIIAANNYGDLILVICGKYIVAKASAHSKMINCLKIAEIFETKVIIISAGEDELVKIWDTKFNLINELHMRKTGFFNDLASKTSFSPQSIDIIICRQTKGS